MQTNVGWLHLASIHTAHAIPNPVQPCPLCFFACSNVTQQTVRAAESHAIALEML